MRFASGIAGVVIVTFALMGSIGIGYLLNGETTEEEVEDYTLVMGANGLYSYTPVPNYSIYSPAQNNYRYSADLSNLGIYTDGINYTKASAANLNPIRTPESGEITTSGAIPVSSFSLGGVTTYVTAVDSTATKSGDSSNYYTGSQSNYYSTQSAIVPLSTILSMIGEYTTVTIHVPTVSSTVSVPILDGYGSRVATASATNNYQPFTVIGQYNADLSQAISNNAGATYRVNGNGTIHAYTAPVSTQSYAWSTSAGTFSGASSTTVGTVSDITVNPNGTATYTYTYTGASHTESRNASDVQLLVWVANSNYTNPLSQITYTKTVYTNVDYLDPNYGVSLSGDSVYWSNGSDLGATSWMFSKPSVNSEYTFTSFGADGVARNTWTVGYSGGWYVQWINSDGLIRSENFGSAWEALQVTEWYTGQLQVAPVSAFDNFTSYEVGLSKTYALRDTTEQTAYTYFGITKTRGSMNFACVQTQVRAGSAVGAMFDGTLNIEEYFPNMESIRLNFDSAAYIGDSVVVGDFVLTTDVSTWTGTFPLTIDGKEYVYTVDMTQPWSLEWTPYGEFTFSFVQPGMAYQTSIEVLEEAPAKSVTLNGQWAIDTDLYEVGTHIEDGYDWNFGVWGMDTTLFIITTMGLTAVLSIVFKLSGVGMGKLDLLVVFFANVILWIIL